MQNESGTIKKSKEKIEREGRKERRKGNRKEGRVKCKKDIGASQEKLTMAKLEQFEQQISYKHI